jgi:hypothetical protein
MDLSDPGEAAYFTFGIVAEGCENQRFSTVVEQGLRG